jgi:hypothetical protein
LIQNGSACRRQTTHGKQRGIEEDDDPGERCFSGGDDVGITTMSAGFGERPLGQETIL